ncbi:uncharacterized protein LOC141857365 [Brevipalpus obovatus]|uniref:uncharacterized protein LOC141857365 n=1 Tax=Brevipalpus obovatus TaxID=246614 RepID=UPI003D9EEA15
MFGSTKESKYCWYCHQKGSQVFCNKCGKGFHSNCYTSRRGSCNAAQSSSIKKCKQCLRLDDSRKLHTRTCSRLGTSNQIGQREMSRTLGQILVNVADTKQPPSIMKTSRKERQFRNVSDFINFSTVENKVRNREYQYPEELLHDLRKIEHVMAIEFGQNSRIEQIGQYILQVELNSQNIDDCPNCAYNDFFGTNDRATLCPRLHRPVLFDRSDGINVQIDIRRDLEELPLIFPGKVIGLNIQNNWKHVFLFGSVKQSCLEIPKNNVFHLREEDLERCRELMNSMESGSARNHLSMAIQEAEQYIENLREEVGENWQYTDKRLVVESNHALYIKKRK